MEKLSPPEFDLRHKDSSYEEPRRWSDELSNVLANIMEDRRGRFKTALEKRSEEKEQRRKLREQYIRVWQEANFFVYGLQQKKSPLEDATASSETPQKDIEVDFPDGLKEQSVRMVTGDNINTAKVRAKECGILKDDDFAVQGPDFRCMPPEELSEIIPKLKVMARSSQTDKHVLVKTSRSMLEGAADTGDGTNDAPALHEADIGLAMGIARTEVAKESADVIVLDDNFSTIVSVAKWGRSAYVNCQKFVQFQLTVNIVALMINFISACVSGSAPLTAMQLLWMNLIMDTLGALALATEPPHDGLIKWPPVGRTESFIPMAKRRNVIGQSIYQIVGQTANFCQVYMLAGSRQAPVNGIQFREAEAAMVLHNDPLVVTLLIMGIKVHRIMVDTGSYANIIFLNTFRRMGIESTLVRECNDEIFGFTGNSVRAMGEIKMSVEMGEYPYQKTLETTFKIVDIPSTYNAIVGRPLLSATEAYVSIRHFCIMFPTPQGNGVVRGDQRSAQECELKIRPREINMLEPKSLS